MKKCRVCKEVKPPEEFYKDGSKNDGLGCRCKPCHKAYDQSRKAERAKATRDYYRSEKGRPRVKASRKKTKKAQHILHPTIRLMEAARVRALEKGIEFSICRTDIVIPERCPILGVPLVRHTQHAPSLDRIDVRMGYIPGNVVVVSRRANAMKSDASFAELLAFCRNAPDFYAPYFSEPYKPLTIELLPHEATIAA